MMSMKANELLDYLWPIHTSIHNKPEIVYRDALYTKTLFLVI